VGTGFHPEMTGRENIYLNGAILGMRRAEITRKFDEIVDFSGVGGYIDTPVKRYSSGMYVRLAFAVAAHLESEILIVDEVLAVGDAEFQKKCLGKMNDVSKGEGRTVLFVSHNMAAIQNLCVKGMLFENGLLRDSGNIEHVVDSYIVLNSKDINSIYVPDTSLLLEVLDVKMLNFNQNTISKLISGQYVEFVIDYQNFTNEEVTLAVGIYDLNEVPLILCNSKLLNTYYEGKGKQSAYLIIEKFPLLAGSYYLNLEIKGANNEKRHISKYMNINVENGDFYKTGQVPEWNRGVLIDFNWK
jgi:lipopolysaccharide transport system ATP-binding protein